MSLSIAVVCEAAADKQIGCDLADRVICEYAEWITPEVIDSYRRYRGFRESDEFLKWTAIKEIAERLNIKTHGHFDGAPGAPDALATRRALRVLRASDIEPEAVILLRDADNESVRVNGINQARNEFRKEWSRPIVVGVADTMRECWVIVGFVAQNDENHARLDEVRDGKQLGFDPTAHPDRLTARTHTAKKNAKRVLEILTDGDPERELSCWRDTPLDTLKSRGERVGLTTYLEEIEELLCSQFK